MGTMPLSSSTVATQIEFEPDIGGVWVGSMMMKPIAARGFFGGTSRFTWRNTPPRGSLSTKFRRVSSCAIQRDWSQTVSPGGGATPPTMTSPTSPSAWQLTTLMTLEVRMITPSTNAGTRARDLYCIRRFAASAVRRLRSPHMV